MDVHLVIVPYDSAQRGTRMGAGPEHLVAAGLPAHLERAGHGVTRAVVETPAESWRAEIRTAFDLARAVAGEVRGARAAGRFPLVLAGNCNVALGVVAGLGRGTGVLWFDAHGDFNTPDTTTGGFLDGMTLAALTGRCWPQLCAGVPGLEPVPDGRAWLLGARDFDPLEAEALDRSGVRRVPAGAIGAAVAGAVAARGNGADQYYLHLDLDVLDPAEGRANALAAAGGVGRPALEAALGGLAERAPVTAMTLSAYDPACDADGRVCRSAFAAVDAVLGGVGRRARS